MSNTYDISVVITAHHEGRLAHHSIESLFRAAHHASECGIRIEVVVVQDRADDPTKRYFSRYEDRDDLSILSADLGDLGLARNHGISKAAGEYVSIMDADNLFCLNWLSDGYQYLKQHNADLIVHPEYQFIFEAENFLFRQPSSTDEQFNPLYMIDFNYWDAVCIARRDIFLQTPYERTASTPGFGYEDWTWNCDTLAKGIEHHVVPNTVHYLRRKKTGSLLAETNNAKRIIRPTRLFDPHVMEGLLKKTGANVNER